MVEVVESPGDVGAGAGLARMPWISLRCTDYGLTDRPERPNNSLGEQASFVRRRRR
jgi:hypothetical protein